MNYLLFKNAFQQFPVLSVQDIKKRFPDFDNRRLVEWQRKAYIQKIRRGFYCFTDIQKDEHFLYFSANKIYAPSYISLESALAFYNLIPEGVFTSMSVTTRNTTQFDTPIGHFVYRHLKPSLFFGYRLLKNSGSTIKIAEPEKVILDYFYFTPINSQAAIKAMRFNATQVKEIFDFEKMKIYQEEFNSKVLNKRISLFKKVIHA